MRNGSSGHDARGRQSVQQPYQGQSGPLPEAPYGPEVSWPSGFRRMEFDTGEYNRLVDEYSGPGPGSGPGSGPAEAGRRPAHRYQPAADDYGYGDPGYADPRYEGPRDRYPTGPQRAIPPHYRPPADNIYPVTGAMEVLRDPDYAPHTRPSSVQPWQPLQSALPALPPAADPRLAGIRYDELRYDDSRYDEPLSDEAWFAELRRDPPPARPDQRRPGGHGPMPGGPAYGGSGYGGSGYGAGASRPGYGQEAGYRPAPGGYGESGPRMSAAPAPSLAPAPPRPAPAAPPRAQMTYLSAPVSVLTPPAPQRIETESQDGYWQQDQTQQYSALLTDRRLAVPDVPQTGPVRRGIGRRRGRSSDHRLWLGLIAVPLVAAAAIFGIYKFEFGGGGPAHTLVMPQQLASFHLNGGLGKSANVKELCAQFTTGNMNGSLCQAFSSRPSAGGVPAQSFVALAAHLPNDNAAASLAAFIAKYPTAQQIPAGSLGGKAACAETTNANGPAAICMWFDNDTLGGFISSTMQAKDLADVSMTTFRPVEERVAK